MTIITRRKKRSWSEFAGQSKTTIEKQMKKVLNDEQIPFTKNPFTLGNVQALFLGGGKLGTVYHIGEAGEAKIYILPAFADPVTRVVFTFTGTADKIRRMENVSVIKIDYDDETEKTIRHILRATNKKIEKPFWNINHHPRFQTAMLLNRRVKRKWKHWLEK